MSYKKSDFQTQRTIPPYFRYYTTTKTMIFIVRAEKVITKLYKVGFL